LDSLLIFFCILHYLICEFQINIFINIQNA
jgi:hypothetical protein